MDEKVKEKRREREDQKDKEDEADISHIGEAPFAIADVTAFSVKIPHFIVFLQQPQKNSCTLQKFNQSQWKNSQCCWSLSKEAFI
jgi:hypothetical protein